MQLIFEISINIRMNGYISYKGSFSFRKSTNVLLYYSVLRVKDLVFHLVVMSFNAFPKSYHSMGLIYCIYRFRQDKFSSSVIQCMDSNICESLIDLISSTENIFVWCWNIQHRPLCCIVSSILLNWAIGKVATACIKRSHLHMNRQWNGSLIPMYHARCDQNC